VQGAEAIDRGGRAITAVAWRVVEIVHQRSEVAGGFDHVQERVGEVLVRLPVAAEGGRVAVAPRERGLQLLERGKRVRDRRRPRFSLLRHRGRLAFLAVRVSEHVRLALDAEAVARVGGDAGFLLRGREAGQAHQIGKLDLELALDGPPAGPLLDARDGHARVLFAEALTGLRFRLRTKSKLEGAHGQGSLWWG
jgi:hypothetical protein